MFESEISVNIEWHLKEIQNVMPYVDVGICRIMQNATKKLESEMTLLAESTCAKNTKVLTPDSHRSCCNYTEITERDS